ncbi:MAG: triose-phosphate isomerase [Methylophilaceae bacterium]|nr:triose-phosphate isomerase [Methylophilaceae bacterium]
MRRKLVVGNWKLHGSLAQNKVLIASLLTNLKRLHTADFAICIPYTYLFQAQALLSGTNIAWGAQNVSQFEEGAFTSSISASMIAEFGCTFAIIGHSEHRALMHESNQQTAIRFARATSAGITPIYCVGETFAERQAGIAENVIKKQILAITNELDDVIFKCAKQLNAVIAYEPVWAIGNGANASAEQAQMMHAYIRSLIAERDAEFAKQVRIIYGGSVTPENVCTILTMPDVDGSLVGRCALEADDFTRICMVASDTQICTIAL